MLINWVLVYSGSEIPDERNKNNNSIKDCVDRRKEFGLGPDFR